MSVQISCAHLRVNVHGYKFTCHVVFVCTYVEDCDRVLVCVLCVQLGCGYACIT